MRDVKQCLLREILEAEAFKENTATLPLGLGKSISGDPVVADLARMPHLLVAGTTGSGKSVGINAMVLSLLYRHTPDDCRMLMIDPKMLELSVYNGIPHLLTPVITDPHKAVAALNWVVREMEERYKRMAALSVRNIDVFNNRVRNAKKRGEILSRTVQTGFDNVGPGAVRNAENGSRAVAAHRRHRRRVRRSDDRCGPRSRGIGATAGADGTSCRHSSDHGDATSVSRYHHGHDQGQFPDADLVQGHVEDRQPHHFERAGRRAASRARATCSIRPVPDNSCACTVLSSRTRKSSHSPRSCEARGLPTYVPGITDVPVQSEIASGAREPGADDLYDRAVAVVLKDGKASTSYIQRRLSIGYNRAADLIERMEREGLVSAANGVGKREILVPRNGAEAAA